MDQKKSQDCEFLHQNLIHKKYLNEISSETKEEAQQNLQQEVRKQVR
jgi:hypothetical protein